MKLYLIFSCPPCRCDTSSWGEDKVRDREGFQEELYGGQEGPGDRGQPSARPQSSRVRARSLLSGLGGFV